MNGDGDEDVVMMRAMHGDNMDGSSPGVQKRKREEKSWSEIATSDNANEATNKIVPKGDTKTTARSYPMLVRNINRKGGAIEQCPKKQSRNSNEKRRALEEKNREEPKQTNVRGSPYADDAGVWCRGALNKRSHSAWAATFSFSWKSSSSS